MNEEKTNRTCDNCPNYQKRQNEIINSMIQKYERKKSNFYVPDSIHKSTEYLLLEDIIDDLIILKH